MKVLFWNTNRNPDIDDAICNIASLNDINIIILAEYPSHTNHLIELLAKKHSYMRQYFSADCDRIIFLGNALDVQPGMQAHRYSIQIVANKYIICAVHLQSQLYTGHQEKRNALIRKIKVDIEQMEKEIHSNRTIVVGDFNENPYDDGCLNADTFHGLPCKEDAIRESREIDKVSYSMFYNPMWNFFGDFRSPPGTYYYSGSNFKNPFWNIFDQVIIRPCLKDQFVKSSLKIITNSGTESLLDENCRPNKRFSDHLPIMFEIKEGI